jgi:predicted transcriptional regulator
VNYENFVGLRKFRNLEKLSLPEEQAMQAIWRTGEGTVKRFLDALQEPRPPYTTLASTIKNLEKKGYLKSIRAGNTYLYRHSIPAEEYKKNFMNGFVHDFFADSYKELLIFLLRQKKLTPGELEEIVRTMKQTEPM